MKIRFGRRYQIEQTSGVSPYVMRDYGFVAFINFLISEEVIPLKIKQGFCRSHGIYQPKVDYLHWECQQNWQEKVCCDQASGVPGAVKTNRNVVVPRSGWRKSGKGDVHLLIPHTHLQELYHKAWQSLWVESVMHILHDCELEQEKEMFLHMEQHIMWFISWRNSCARSLTIEESWRWLWKYRICGWWWNL